MLVYHVTDSFIRSKIRRIAGKKNSQYPVVVIPGNKKPKFKGERAHYVNTAGDWIYHPSAYSRKGFSSMRYKYSTQRIEVGAQYLSKILLKN